MLKPSERFSTRKKSSSNVGTFGDEAVLSATRRSLLGSGGGVDEYSKSEETFVEWDYARLDFHNTS